MASEAVRVKPTAIYSGVITPQPLHPPPVGVIRSVGIKVIVADDPAQCLEPVTAIRHHNVVSHLHICPEGERAYYVPIVAAGVRVLFRLPFGEDLTKFIEPLIRPIDVVAPTEVNQVII